MVPIKNEANSSERANFMHVKNQNDAQFGVNQQVNDDMKAHFGGSGHFMANAIQTSSKGELANYHHQSLGSPTTWKMLNALKNSPSKLMSMPGMDKDLITKYLEPSTATAKGHMVRVRKILDLHTAIDRLNSKHGRRYRTWHQYNKCAALLKMKCFVLVYYVTERKIQSTAT